jgi:hypothetical protein
MGKPTTPEPGDLHAARRLTDAVADRAESAGRSRSRNSAYVWRQLLVQALRDIRRSVRLTAPHRSSAGPFDQVDLYADVVRIRMSARPATRALRRAER